MSDQLSGPVRGESQSDMRAQVRSIAATYFGENERCIAITLSDQTAEVLGDQTTGSGEAYKVTGFSAHFVATVQHRSDNPTYGPPKCIKCRKEIRT